MVVGMCRVAENLAQRVRAFGTVPEESVCPVPVRQNLVVEPSAWPCPRVAQKDEKYQVIYTEAFRLRSS